MEVQPGEMRAFITVAEELHFGRAAGRLHLTPSRVSQVVRRLELRLGCRLFDRTSRTVSLTPLGQRLLDRVRPAWDELEQALDQTRHEATGVTGTLRLGMNHRINGGPHLEEIVQAFEDRHPACRVDFLDIGLIRSELDWLRRADADLLAIRLPVSDPDVAIGPLLSCEARVVVLARDHPLTREGSVCLDDLAGYRACSVPGMRSELLDDLLPPRTQAGHRLRRFDVRSNSEALMRTAHGETVYLSVQPLLDHVSHPGLVVRSVRDLPPSRTALAWITDSCTPAIKAFARAARDVLSV